MLTDLVDWPYLPAHCRPNVKAGPKMADETESLGWSRRERRLIEHQLTVGVQDEAFALW